MRILVTGADGFIGSNMVTFLKQRGHFVRAVGKAFTKERSKPLGDADEVIPCDLRNIAQVILVCEDIDWVVHLAADMGGVGYFTANDYEPYFNNMRMDMNILQSCELTKVKRLYYAGSACMYPTVFQQNPENPPLLKEDQIVPAYPDQMYGWEKLMTTLLCDRAPFDARVGIQHTVYGPFQETKGERMKFPTAIATKVLQAKEDGNPIEIWGDGSQVRSFLYIQDALEKIYRVLTDEKYDGPVNIGSSDLVSVKEVAELCCEIVGIEPNFVFNTDAPSGVLARGCDNTKFENTYGYVDQIDLREGFSRLIRWIKENQ